MSDDGSNDLTRRTFVKGSGAVAGLGLLGAGTGSVAAHDGFHQEFANPRVWELSKVWDRGYRGRPSRSVGVGDTGCDARHPDLPWNGVRIVEEKDGLAMEQVTHIDPTDEPVGDEFRYTGTLGPGVEDANADQQEVHALDVHEEADEVEATATWEPQRQDNELLLLDENDNTVASSTDFNPASGEGEHVKGPVEPGYKVAIKTYINVAADYEITGQYLSNDTEIVPFDGDPLPDAPVDRTTPKLVGWKGGTLARDGDGHGTHTSSISAGTGQGSAVDASTVSEEAPRAVLLPGDVLSYEVDPEAGNADSTANGGVYAAVYGENVDIAIEDPDGRTVETATVRPSTYENDSSASGDVTLADAYAETPGTYTVHVKPTEQMAGSTGASTHVARVERVSVGALLPPSETAGDRTGDHPTLHAGVAPNASLVTIQGLDNGLTSISEHPDFFTENFGLRTINFSFGGLQTERLGLSDTYLYVKRMAEGGVITISSAGNFGPLTGSTGPSGADEAIAVAATGPMDGLTAYTSGGTIVRGQSDGNEGSTPAGELYRKPDVSAPGGPLDDNVNAALAGDPDSLEPVRDYVSYSGTSMAAPYTNGVAGLVAEAMEFDAPETIALPAPTATGYQDVLRLKQVLLATATETAFTAAPYHRAHAPTYDFGGRDPYEGFGRVNPDAAVDAVARELSGTSAETVGLNRQEDDRAVAGYVGGDPGVYEVSIDFSHLSGGNRGMAKSGPHLDLFVYDAEEPWPNGDPNVVARAQGPEGDASVQFTAAKETDSGIEAGTYFVVAKLVNVPGVVNGYDVQAHFDLTVERVQDLIVTGTRTDDGTVFTGGQTDHVKIEVEATEPVIVRDVVPVDWELLTEYSVDVRREPGDQDGHYHVYYDPDGDGETTEDDAETSPSFEYFVEAPSDGVAESDSYEFGPVEVSHDGGDTWIAVPGTSDRNYVVAQSQP